MTYVWLNGTIIPQSEALIPANDRGFLLGDGLFETMRVVAGQVPLWEQHLQRLQQGAALLGFSLPFVAVPTIVQSLATANDQQDGIARLTVSRGPGPRGYAAPTATQPTTLVQLTPWQPLQQPWSIGLSDTPVVAMAPWQRLKHTSALPRIMLQAEATRDHCQDLIQLNTDGQLVEGIATNLFLVDSDQHLHTPALTCGCLPGVARGWLIKHCDVTEGYYTPIDLRAASEVFMTNAIHGVIPVATLHAVRQWPAPGPVSQRLRELWQERLETSN